MFNVLTSMKFFKHYIVGKVFSLWKGNVRFNMYNRTRQNIARNLTQTRPDFLNSFKEISQGLYVMREKETFSVPKGSKFPELTDFVSEQKTYRESAK